MVLLSAGLSVDKRSLSHSGGRRITRHIYLLGFRGCGKSTVGRGLAALLGWPFLDTDDRIEELSGQTISNLFSQVGEEGFRDLEQQVIAECERIDTPTVIALGGGAVLRKPNREVIARTGRRLWLRASPETHFQRIAQDGASASRRPALTNHDAFTEIKEVLGSREPLYAEIAEKTFNVDDLPPDKIVREIVDWLEAAS